MSDVDVRFNEVLDPNNELGVKGIGEGGPAARRPRRQCRVSMRCAPHGVRHIDMPLTSEKVWRAINGR